tara:strand:+ start:219 stop:815 length:597 start_codon:yes stop_codon:yes gene_type:complete
METFQTFSEARGGQGLTIFDIDKTLFHSDTKVGIKKDGKIIKTLDKFEKYKLKKGEEFDFGEFKDAKRFAQTASPIGRMIAKAKVIIRNATKSGSKVIFVTARADMDDKKLFINTLKAHGLDMSKVYVERAGNLGIDTAKNKSTILKTYLDSGKYARVRMFDDQLDNLKALLSLKDDYPKIKFEAWKVLPKGSIKTVR